VAKEKKPAAPKSVEELVRHALKLAATKPGAKWTGTTATALFNTKEANHETAIAECTRADASLLKQIGKGGALTAAGFERIASELTPEEVTAFAKATAVSLSAEERVTLLSGVIGRAPAAAAELTPLLDEAVATKKVELEAATAAKAKHAAAAAANRAALERALELSKQDLENELDALRRQWQALGQKLSDLPAHAPRSEPEVTVPSKPVEQGGVPEPKTSEEKDFRRYEADRLAAAWRDAWDAKKDEGRDCLESAMWNIRGLRLVGEVGARVAFDGRYHESDSSVFSGAAVEVVRPGWLLKEHEGDHVALKAAVTKA
jgi:hypothetical protein